MKNVIVTVKGNKLNIEVDLSKTFGDSASGKTIIVASSEGNEKVEGHDGIRFGLNVFKSKGEKK